MKGYWPKASLISYPTEKQRDNLITDFSCISLCLGSLFGKEEGLGFMFECRNKVFPTHPRADRSVRV